MPEYWDRLQSVSRGMQPAPAGTREEMFEGLLDALRGGAGLAGAVGRDVAALTELAGTARRPVRPPMALRNITPDVGGPGHPSPLTPTEEAAVFGEMAGAVAGPVIGGLAKTAAPHVGRLAGALGEAVGFERAVPTHRAAARGVYEQTKAAMQAPGPPVREAPTTPSGRALEAYETRKAELTPEPEPVAGPVPAADPAAPTPDPIDPNTTYLLDTPERVDDFLDRHVAWAQRGEPEAKMSAIWKAHGSGVFPYVSEHLGDLTNRMSGVPPSMRHHYSKEKIYMAWRDLEDVPWFIRTIDEQMGVNARRNNVPVGQLRRDVEAAAREYADAHAKIPVFNEAQERARDAAVAYGRLDFTTAHGHVAWLKREIDKGREHWDSIAGTVDPDRFNSWLADPDRAFPVPPEIDFSPEGLARIKPPKYNVGPALAPAAPTPAPFDDEAALASLKREMAEGAGAGAAAPEPPRATQRRPPSKTDTGAVMKGYSPSYEDQYPLSVSRDTGLSFAEADTITEAIPAMYGVRNLGAWRDRHLLDAIEKAEAGQVPLDAGFYYGGKAKPEPRHWHATEDDLAGQGTYVTKRDEGGGLGVTWWPEASGGRRISTGMTGGMSQYPKRQPLIVQAPGTPKWELEYLVDSMWPNKRREVDARPIQAGRDLLEKHRALPALFREWEKALDDPLADLDSAREVLVRGAAEYRRAKWHLWDEHGWRVSPHGRVGAAREGADAPSRFDSPLLPREQRKVDDYLKRAHLTPEEGARIERIQREEYALDAANPGLSKDLDGLWEELDALLDLPDVNSLSDALHMADPDTIKNLPKKLLPVILGVMGLSSLGESNTNAPSILHGVVGAGAAGAGAATQLREKPKQR